MASSTVYSATTAPNPKTSCFLLPSEHLDKGRFIVKGLEVLLSLVAFVLEEVVNSCESCSALYFFEFVSCTAFLFTLLLLILLSTTLHTRVGIDCWKQVDFIYTLAIAVFFCIASIVFASANSGTSVEGTAVAFGFLATIAFVIDLALFWRSNGFPFTSASKAEAANTEPPAATGEEPEREKLNNVNNGTE